MSFMIDVSEVMYVLSKFSDFVRKEKFTEYKNSLSVELLKAIIGSYNQKEPQIVKSIVGVFNGMPKNESINEIQHNAIFIHARRVKFDYYDNLQDNIQFNNSSKKTERELGDAIFILSICFNGKKYFEKFTISQFKKDDQKQKNSRWVIDQAQLYLLSRFPEFCGGKESIFPNNYNLSNEYGCLGSYNLLYKPGDFIYLTAPILEGVLGGQKSIGIDKVMQYGTQIDKIKIKKFYPFFLFPYCRCLMCFDEECLNHLYHNFNVLGYNYYSANVYEFIDNYLRGNIGELCYTPIGKYNESAADFIYDLLENIKNSKDSNGSEIGKTFYNIFYKYPYVYSRGSKGNTDNKQGIKTSNRDADRGNGDNGKNGGGSYLDSNNEGEEGRGIGIIHTLININAREE